VYLRLSDEESQDMKVSHTRKGEQDSIIGFQICTFLQFAMQCISAYHLLIRPPTEGIFQFLAGDVRRSARQGASNVILEASYLWSTYLCFLCDRIDEVKHHP